MKILDPDFLAPKQFSKMADSRDNFVCAIPIACACARRLMLSLVLAVASENQALNLPLCKKNFQKNDTNLINKCVLSDHWNG